MTIALKMYVTDVDHIDWGEYAKMQPFAINIAQKRVRGDTSFYLVYGWDPRSTLEAYLPLRNTKLRDQDPR